jgi:hypothetical protein
VGPPAARDVAGVPVADGAATVVTQPPQMRDDDVDACRGRYTTARRTGTPAGWASTTPRRALPWATRDPGTAAS